MPHGQIFWDSLIHRRLGLQMWSFELPQDDLVADGDKADERKNETEVLLIIAFIHINIAIHNIEQMATFNSNHSTNNCVITIHENSHVEPNGSGSLVKIDFILLFSEFQIGLSCSMLFKIVWNEMNRNLKIVH